jgi:ribosomal protein S18 acetylase RimI-like enzyme
VVSPEHVPLAWGTALFNSEFPISYVHNVARPDDAAVDAGRIAHDIEPIYADRGLKHRMVKVYDEAHGDRLDPGFVALGWESTRLWVMVATELQGAPADTVRVVDFGEFRPWLEASMRLEPYATDEETVRQLTDRERLAAGAVDARYIVAFEDGRAAAHAHLYMGDGLAEIDNVGTLPDRRRKGHARAVMSTAIALARSEGCDTVFLFADQDDWPKDFYARMGFERIGTIFEFTRTPEGN